MTKLELIDKYTKIRTTATAHRDEARDLANANFSCRNISNGEEYSNRESYWDSVVQWCNGFIADLNQLNK